jgi:hypothetical protein
MVAAKTSPEHFDDKIFFYWAQGYISGLNIASIKNGEGGVT